MADRPATRCMANRAAFHRDHKRQLVLPLSGGPVPALLWGIGGLMYGLGMRYLGMSLGNSVLLGFTAACGALVPSIYYNFHPAAGKTTFHDLLTTSWGRTVLAGVALCLVGIYICGRAGIFKERELSEEKKKESIKEFSLIKGLIVCIVSGILSACFNYGIEAGAPMSAAANNAWKLSHAGHQQLIFCIAIT